MNGSRYCELAVSLALDAGARILSRTSISGIPIPRQSWQEGIPADMGARWESRTSRMNALRHRGWAIFLYTCTHECLPGACDFDTNADNTADCCIDGLFFPNGMSETCCFTEGGTYHGNGTSCTLPACSPFTACP